MIVGNSIAIQFVVVGKIVFDVGRHAIANVLHKFCNIFGFIHGA